MYTDLTFIVLCSYIHDYPVELQKYIYTCNCVSLEEVLPIMHYGIPTMHSMFDSVVANLGVLVQILYLTSWILSKLSVNWPPQINIVRCNPCNVFVDPFQVECQLTSPLPSLPTYNFLSWVECQLTPLPSPPLCPHLQLSFLSCLSIDPPPLPPHLQLSFLSWVSIDPPPLPPLPPLPPHLQPSFLSWVSIDPPPLLSLPTYNFLSWVECRSTPPTNFTFQIFNIRM